MNIASFTITTPTTAIRVDEEGHGVAAFIVGNQTGRSVRARASVSPFAPAAADWFKIEGDAERLLSLGASDSYTVRIAVPAGAGTGARSFRLDIVSLDRPDEEWAHGPAVGFDLAGRDDVPRPGYLETIVGALAGSVGGLVVAAAAGLVLLIVSGASAQHLDVGVVPVFAGGLVASVALGGAIGIFGALTFRDIPRPAPWQTAAAYLVLSLLFATALEFVPGPAAPAGAPIANTIGDVIASNPNLIRVSPPPDTETTGTSSPASPTPASPTPAPPPQVGSGFVGALLTLIAAVVAALVARAFTRWRVFGGI